MKKIFIADDKQANFNALKLVLEEAIPHCHLKHALNGREIVEMVYKEKPDLVLMDIIMPEVDGVEATQSLRKRFAKGDLPIIAMTAADQPEDRKRVLDAGCNEYLVKPFAIRELMEKIEFYLGL